MQGPEQPLQASIIEWECAEPVVLQLRGMDTLSGEVTLLFLFTVELQWLEHFRNHENMFETGVVRSNEC